VAPIANIGGDGLAGLVDLHGKATLDQVGGGSEADRACADDGNGEDIRRSHWRSPWSAAGGGAGSEAVADALDEDAALAAEDLQHPRGIAVPGLGQGGEDVRPLKADVAQEMVVQLAEGDDMPAVAGRAGEVEEEWDEAWHLSLLFIFPVLPK
jgi:hypothetical protein